MSDFVRDVAVSQRWPRTYTFSLWTAPPGRRWARRVPRRLPRAVPRPHIYTSDADEAAALRAALPRGDRVLPAHGLGARRASTATTGTRRWCRCCCASIYAWDSLFQRTRTLLTIHNLGYQGASAGALDRRTSGSPGWAHLFDQEDLRAGRVNFLRTGLALRRPGDDGQPDLRARDPDARVRHGARRVAAGPRATLVGILNGVDYEVWSPERDALHPAALLGPAHRGQDREQAPAARRARPRSRKRPPAGRDRLPAACRRRGFDLCFRRAAGAAGDDRPAPRRRSARASAAYEEFFDAPRSASSPGGRCYHRGYNDELAHLIEAGGRHVPDALALRAVRPEPDVQPALRHDSRRAHAPAGWPTRSSPYEPGEHRGTGFVFEHFTPDGLRWALRLALETYRDRRAWIGLMRRAMARDFSWSAQAARYVELYAWLTRR